VAKAEYAAARVVVKCLLPYGGGRSETCVGVSYW
jgi:hypothetical protein